jgi:hypothetical protein
MAIVNIKAERGENLRGAMDKINAALQPNTVTISKEEYENLLGFAEQLKAMLEEQTSIANKGLSRKECK